VNLALEFLYQEKIHYCLHYFDLDLSSIDHSRPVIVARLATSAASSFDIS
jgi:hypothetical protein